VMFNFVCGPDHIEGEWEVCADCLDKYSGSPPSNPVLLTEKRCSNCRFVLSSERTRAPGMYDVYALDIQPGRCRKCPPKESTNVFARMGTILADGLKGYLAQ
jgi:hypothetical protein